MVFCKFHGALAVNIFFGDQYFECKIDGCACATVASKMAETHV